MDDIVSDVLFDPELQHSSFENVQMSLDLNNNDNSNNNNKNSNGISINNEIDSDSDFSISSDYDNSDEKQTVLTTNKNNVSNAANTKLLERGARYNVSFQPLTFGDDILVKDDEIEYQQAQEKI